MLANCTPLTQKRYIHMRDTEFQGGLLTISKFTGRNLGDLIAHEIAKSKTDPSRRIYYPIS